MFSLNPSSSSARRTSDSSGSSSRELSDCSRCLRASAGPRELRTPCLDRCLSPGFGSVPTRPQSPTGGPPRGPDDPDPERTLSSQLGEARRRGAVPSLQEHPAVFVERWEQFKRFVGDLGLGAMHLTQYELSYINHVVEGSSGTTFVASATCPMVRPAALGGRTRLRAAVRHAFGGAEVPGPSARDRKDRPAEGRAARAGDGADGARSTGNSRARWRSRTVDGRCPRAHRA